MTIKLFVLFLILFSAIYAVATRDKPVPDSTSLAVSTYDPRALERAKRDEVRANLSIRNFSWSASYSVMTANFTFWNGSDYDVKDVEVRCTHSAPSGTKIDQ